MALLIIFDKAIWIGQGLPSKIKQKFTEDAFDAQYYGNKDSLFNYINYHGTSILWFIGYANDSTFMFDPPFLDLSDLDLLNNNQKYFISVYYNQRAVLDSNTNLSRELLFRKNSGSLGAILINGLTFWLTIAQIQQIWVNRFYDPAIHSISQVIDTLYLPSGIPVYERKVTSFWGDPSLKLKFDATVNVEEPITEIPNDYVLHSNYPNPFNNSTKISYEIPVQSNVLIILYDVLGREVATLVALF